MYLGAIVASAALIAGFGAALVVYGPLGTPVHQAVGSNLNTPPKGVSFGSAQVQFASQMGENFTYSFNTTTQSFNGPCASPGVAIDNTTAYVPLNATNETAPVNLTNGTVTLVCLNAVANGTVNATWYANTTNFYGTGGVGNASTYNYSGTVIDGCAPWALYHNLNNTTYNGSYLPCQTYFEENNNTVWLPTFDSNGTNGTVLWSPGQNGYLPSDLVYSVPVLFSNASVGVYAISVAIAGVTPVAQTTYFNVTSAGMNATVLFTFDMTAAWLMDLSTVNGNTTYNATAASIYASIGVVSSVVSQCAYDSATSTYVCPVATPVG